MLKTTLKTLTELLGPDKVLTSDEVLQTRRLDWWGGSLIKELSDTPVPNPGMVVQPRTVEDVQAVMRTANANKTPVIPFGLGSGVVGGVVAHPDALLLDMSEMKQTREIDEVNLIASFDAGKRGSDAEAEVAAKGLTIGHWPQSIELSSVGGWIATRASGQFSTAYGNIEDIVYSIEAVLPNGEIINTGKAPRAAAGPDLRHLLMGSEGTLAVITGVKFSLRRAAPSKVGSIFFAKDMAAGFEAQRQIIQAGWRPPVIRQYDASESNRHFGDDIDEGAIVILMVHEGEAESLVVEKAKVTEIATGCGLTIGPAKIVDDWMVKRNSVPHILDFLKNNIVVDTIEVSAPWSRINQIYDRAVAGLQTLPGILAGTAHSSHAYRSGVNLYFTYAARVDGPADMEKAYFAGWRQVMEATIAEDGGVAHHHGIGRIRKDYLEHDLGASGISTLRAIKGAIDPNNIMNPGVLLPDA